MDSARRIDTGAIISAEDLWEIENPASLSYICPDCNVVVMPAAFGANQKVRPYFRCGPYHPHDTSCNLEGRTTLIATAATMPVLSQNPPPLPVYTRLNLPIDDPRVPLPGETGPVNSKVQHLCNGGDSTGLLGDRHDRTASTIRPICRQFADFPHPQDRETRLTLPGMRTHSYAEAFMAVRNAILEPDPGMRIFYVRISLGGIKKKKDEVIVNLYAGEFGKGTEQERRKLVRPAKLRIDISGWPQLRVDSLIKELDITLTEEKEQEKHKNAGPNVKALKSRQNGPKGVVFFLGKRDGNDSLLFHVSDRRLICAFVTRIDDRASKFRTPSVDSRLQSGWKEQTLHPLSTKQRPPEPAAGQVLMKPPHESDLPVQAPLEAVSPEQLAKNLSEIQKPPSELNLPLAGRSIPPQSGQHQSFLKWLVSHFWR